FEDFSVSTSEGLHKGYDSRTNDVSTAYSVSFPSVSKSQKEGSSSYTDKVIHYFFTNQPSAPQLDYDDLEQINDDAMEEIDLKVAMISMRIKKFHNMIGRKAKGNQYIKRRDVGYNGNKTRDNGRRPAYQDDSKALVTIDGEDIDWSGHVVEDAQNYAMMAYSTSNSGSLKEKEDLKTKIENWQNSSKNLSRLLNTQMSANDKFGLGYGDYRYGSILSYKNEVLQSVFMNKASDLEDTVVNDRYADGMHAVPPHMIGNYMPSGPDVEIDYYKFTYDPKQTSVDESDSKPSEYASCESDSSVETTTFMPDPVENAPKVVCEPKVWTDALIIEEYESDGDNDSVSNVQEDKEKPRNKAHLADYQEFKGGFVAFGGSNRRITGKGTKKAGKLDFEDVYYVEELKHYNLFYVSQMCDKKNKVLFTDTDCLVLSPDFKLLDENQKGKQHKASCKAKIVSSVNQPLQILHMDLFGPTSVRSINHKTYCLVITDGFSRIKEEYSNARTSQQNGVAEKKNKTLIEAARTMLADLFLPTTFWAKAVNTACYVFNRVLVTKPQNKIPYELLTSKQPIISYLRHFGCHVSILNTIDQLGKFDRKSNSGFLVGYSLNSKAFRVYNLETKRVKENLHVNFLENKPNVAGKGHAWMFDLDYLTNSMNYEPILVENQANKSAGPKEANHSVGIQANDDQGEKHFVLPIWSAYSTTVKSSGDKIEKNTDFKTCEKPVSQVEQIFLEELEKLKRRENEANDATESLRKEATYDIQNAHTSSTNLLNTVSTPLSTVGPLRAFNDGELSYHDDPLMLHLEDIYASPSEGIFNDSSYDDESVVTDFNNLETTVNVSPTPTTRIHTIHPKTKILRDPMSVVQTRSKVNKNSEAHALEGIDYDEVFALVARIEAIRIFLAFASYMGFIVNQMDVKSAFLYGIIDEEVYVTQPPGFVDPRFPNKVYKVVKALYGLHQAPKAWYVTLSTFLEKSGYKREVIDKTLFIKQDKKDIMLVQVYVDDIIFGSTKKYWCDEFEETMKNSVKTASTPIETHKPLVKDKEAIDVDVHLNRYLKGQPKLGLWYPKVSSFDLEAYSDSDYAGANLDRKSTTGGCQFLGRRLILWQCKKQTIMATSTIEAEYITAAHCCGQTLWIQNQLLDYGFNIMNTKIYIDNESTICIVKNLVFHSKTKHIEIRHHFIRDAFKKKLIHVLKIHTDDNVADLLIKAFDVSSKELASPKQTALGKDILNLFMAGSFPKLYEKVCAIRPKVSAAVYTSVLIEAQQYISNDSPVLRFNTPRCDEDGVELMELMVFTALVTIKKVNNAVQLRALIDGKRVVVTEDVIRQDLRLDDADGWKFLIHTLVQCVSAKRTAWNEFSCSMASAVICLATCRKFNFSKTCATLSQKVAELGQDKHTQALEILKLKKRVKKLEKKKSRYSGLKSLRKVGGKIEVIDADEDITLVDVDTQVDMDYELQGRISQEDVSAATKEVSAVEPNMFDDEEVTMTMAQTLIKMKAEKAKLFDEKYQSLKRKLVSIAHARKNMIIYLKNIAGYKMDYFREMSKEDVQNMLEIVPVFEFKVEALQVKYPIIDWEIHSEGSRSYWKIIRVGGITKAYQIFEDMLKEKDYPLSNNVMIMMLSAKLQVEEDSEMARDLMMKIFMEANKPKSKSKADTAAEVTKEITLSS
nr:hypothetical protein [Tanacetum cinerariifolium]